ncbi:MAG TPA: TonB family protein [Bryobacteraceae bacterium]|jgi:protein TonB
MGRSPTVTPAPPPVDPDYELNFLRNLREPVSAQRLSRAAIGSIVFHAAAFLLFWFLPEVTPSPLPRPRPDTKQRVVLLIPRDLLQQDLRQSQIPSPRSSAASVPRQAVSRPEPPRFRPPAPTPGQSGTPTILPPVLDAPPDNIAATPSPTSVPAPITVPGPAPKPKSPFEAVGGPPPPSPTKGPPTPAEEALRNAIRAAAGPIPVHADTSQDLSGIETVTDTEGVDFTQYYAQAMRKVKPNWLNRIPEEALRGRRGVVKIDFSINRQGLVYGLKIVSTSGVQSLDLAAVSAVTASSPFAFLPAAYKKDHIEMVWTFTYTTVQK